MYIPAPQVESVSSNSPARTYVVEERDCSICCRVHMNVWRAFVRTPAERHHHFTTLASKHTTTMRYCCRENDIAACRERIRLSGSMATIQLANNHLARHHRISMTSTRIRRTIRQRTIHRRAALYPAAGTRRRGTTLAATPTPATRISMTPFNVYWRTPRRCLPANCPRHNRRQRDTAVTFAARLRVR